MGKAPQTTITAPSGKGLSTIDPKTLAPRKVYKYLGVYLFTEPDPILTYELAKSRITSFFTFLHPLNLTLSEYIQLVNLQLIPTLQYRLMAHPLDQSQLQSLQNIIWKNIAIHHDPEKRNRISRLVSNKDKYTCRPHGGLDLRHFQHCLNISTVNAAIRYLNNEGPEETNQLFRQAALNEEISMVLKLISDAWHSLDLRFDTTSSEINTPPHLLQKHEQAYVRFTTYSNNRVTKWGNKQRHQSTDLGIHRGIVTDTSCNQAAIYFPGDNTTFNLRGSEKVYTIHPPVIAAPTNILGNHHLLIPSYNACPPPLQRGPAPSLTNGIFLPGSTTSFALNGAFCGWPGRGERLLRAKHFQGGAGARNQVQSRAEYRCTLLSSSALSQ